MRREAEPRFDIDLEWGQQAELLVADIVRSMRDGSTAIEVKRDGQWKRTGNVYVELECRRGGQYRPSGLSTTTAGLWAFVIGDPEIVLVVPTDWLRAEVERPGTPRREELDGSHPTKGAVLSTTRLLGRLKSPPPDR